MGRLQRCDRATIRNTVHRTALPVLDVTRILTCRNRHAASPGSFLELNDKQQRKLKQLTLCTLASRNKVPYHPTSLSPSAASSLESHQHLSRDSLKPPQRVSPRLGKFATYHNCIVASCSWLQMLLCILVLTCLSRLPGRYAYAHVVVWCADPALQHTV